jgi:uncharacterized protein (UPF0276 family)
VSDGNNKWQRFRPVPCKSGIGLRAEHYQQILESRPTVGWFEVHSENYFGDGGKPLAYLERIREHYPLSLHGVGMSLGSTDPLNQAHLQRLKTLIERFEPFLVSEHLSWSSIDNRYLNDLIPLPYTEEALAHICKRITQAQDYLGRQLLIENVSSYLRYKHSTIPEWEFLAETATRSGCAILLDVNNIYVNACNHGFAPVEYLQAIPREPVQEIHLAGHTVKRLEDGEILIDTHNQRITEAVWELYRFASRKFNAVPTLIEWDTDLPPLEVLLDEARKADTIQEHNRALVA